MLEIKNAVTEMKNGFDRSISMAEEGIPELEGLSIEITKLKMKEKKKEVNRTSKNCGTTTKTIHVIEIPEGEEIYKGAEE